MTPENQEKAVTIVNNLRGRNGTKIYEAIKVAMNCMKKIENNDHNQQILFFTDGMDYHTATDVCLEKLRTMKKEMSFTCPINTYGFGMYSDVNTD